MKKATHKQTKQHNRDLVLRTIFSSSSISRAEISRVTHLTRTTVSDLVSDLISEGLVEEVGFGPSIGGKSPILLSIVPDSRFMIALNLGQDKFVGAIVNLRGVIEETVEVDVHAHNGSELPLVYQIIDQLINKGRRPIAGIGVGTPGLVNTRQGIVINAVNLDWQDLPLGQLLHDKYQIPVSILNDSQATAIGEFVHGDDHKPDDNLIVVNVAHGIGAGILVNGRLFQGDGGGAGEIGHVVVQENGHLCRCGKRGCLETVSSMRSVLQQLGLPTIDSVHEQIMAGKKNAVDVVETAGHYLGISLANLIGTLNIRKIVVTGEMTRLGSIWLESVDASMRNAALARMSEGTQLKIGKLDYRACILGASAFLVLDNYSILYSSKK